MSMKVEELISRKCHNIESKSLSGHLVVIDKVAFEAIEMAREEEREKAIEALDIAIMTIFEKTIIACQ